MESCITSTLFILRQNALDLVKGYAGHMIQHVTSSV